MPSRPLDDALLAVLASPLHGLVDRRLCGLRFSARRSGRQVRLPVQYVPVHDGVLVLVGRADTKTWWRTFVAEHSVEVLLDGRWRPGVGTLVRHGEPGHAEALTTYRRLHSRVPADSRDPFLRIALGPRAERSPARFARTWMAPVAAEEPLGFAPSGAPTPR